MPRDIGLPCKKRHHPDGLHLSSSVPKRLLAISEAELGSSHGLAYSPATPSGSTLNTPRMNSASSALINSDCSTSTRADHSSVFTDAASSKLEAPAFTHSYIPCHAASCNFDALKSVDGDPPLEGKGKGIWTYCSDSSMPAAVDFEAELSDVTFEKHAYTLSSGHKPDGGFGFRKETHVISRRDASDLSSNLGMDEPWHKGVYGYGDYMSRGKQSESISTLAGARQRRDSTHSSMACETGTSCATGYPSMEEIGSKHFFHSSRSVCKEASMAPSNIQTRAEVLVGPRVQERSGCTDYNIIPKCPISEVVSHSSSIHKAVTEELGPSYVLSSGRLSLEEEAKLGRRPPTIDHDFEEYFSSLML